MSTILKRGLIVDDATFMRKMLAEILVKHGFDVVGEAGNGKEAVEKYRELTPDFVIMDITMPIMDGLQALALITRIDPASRVLMCSAMGQQQMVLDAMKRGAADFIVKPFNPDRVVGAISKALE